MEERNWNEEELIENLEIEKIAKRKVMKISIVVAVILATLIICLIGIPKDIVELVFSIIIIIVYIMVIFLFYLSLKYVYISQEKWNRSEAFVKEYLSNKEPMEVIPIKDKYLMSLNSKKIAKIYAIIDKKDDSVIISIKHAHDTEYCEYGRIDKGKFKEQFKL